jgi:hypothetical protein
VPFQYIQPPQDGIYDFGFYATPPVEPSASVITPIKATHHLASISDNLKGIRIHSQTNTNVALLNQPSPVPAVIYAINDVQITATTDVPAQLELRVIGTVNSGGWSQPTLIPFKYLLPPQDGIYDFTFYATPPANPSGGGFGSIEVIYKLGLVPNDVKGYRVHASTNSIETLLAP